ncbi:MAG: DUF1254 domain-containing protein [Nitrososphaeraceae archaeon]
MTVLPPHYNGTVPSGYFVAKSDTTQSLIVGRVFINNYNNLTSAINTIKETRAYPLSEADNPPQQKFIDVSGKLVKMQNPFILWLIFNYHVFRKKRRTVRKCVHTAVRPKNR